MEEGESVAIIRVEEKMEELERETESEAEAYKGKG